MSRPELGRRSSFCDDSSIQFSCFRAQPKKASTAPFVGACKGATHCRQGIKEVARNNKTTSSSRGRLRKSMRSLGWCGLPGIWSGFILPWAQQGEDRYCAYSRIRKQSYCIRPDHKYLAGSPPIRFRKRRAWIPADRQDGGIWQTKSYGPACLRMGYAQLRHGTQGALATWNGRGAPCQQEKCADTMGPQRSDARARIFLHR